MDLCVNVSVHVLSTSGCDLYQLLSSITYFTLLTILFLLLGGHLPPIDHYLIPYSLPPTAPLSSSSPPLPPSSILLFVLC